LRNEKGISQRELADRLKINRSTYARYETSATQPDFETLKLLANFYDVTIDYILGNSDRKEPTIEEKLSKELRLRDGENIYFYDMEGLDDEDIEMLKKQIELYREMAEKRKKEK
ncbi:MAG TPA: helix-turn-helix domain-containing protein, partial [Massilibacterium sp.]|nr:helix-turn-helix domain-containing protein [Massilibacterium sp.]